MGGILGSGAPLGRHGDRIPLRDESAPLTVPRLAEDSLITLQLASACYNVAFDRTLNMKVVACFHSSMPMTFGDSSQRFGITWLFFGYTFAMHVLDEAAHDFLSFYNPNVIAIRRVWPSFFMPVFTLQSWIGTLLFTITLWLALAPLAFRRPLWLRILAVPVALVAGVANGCAHIIVSIYYKRMMPGVYSAPLMLLSGVLLLLVAVRDSSLADEKK